MKAQCVRDWHYLCGVIAYETVIPENGEGSARPYYVKVGFRLKLLNWNLCIVKDIERESAKICARDVALSMQGRALNNGTERDRVVVAP